MENRPRPVFIYGGGSGGRDLSDFLGKFEIEVTGVIDKNYENIAQSWAVQCIDPHFLNQLPNQSIVIISLISGGTQIYEELTAYENIIPVVVTDALAQYYSYQSHKWYCGESALAPMDQAIKEAYGLLGDAKSKAIFDLRLKITKTLFNLHPYKKLIEYADAPNGVVFTAEISDYKNCFEGQMYFENDLVELRDGMIFYDCGAFDGDTIRNFTQSMQRFGLQHKEIVGFEPDQENFQNLQSNMSHVRGINFVNAGLYDKSGTARFASSDIQNQTEATIVHEDQDKRAIKSVADTTVRLTTIDEIANGQPVDLIKMDIEGSEAKALIGGRRVISQHAPTLIVSAYHNFFDLFMLPTLIKELNSNYEIFLRHFSFSLSETVIIARAG